MGYQEHEVERLSLAINLVLRAPPEDNHIDSLDPGHVFSTVLARSKDASEFDVLFSVWMAVSLT